MVKPEIIKVSKSNRLSLPKSIGEHYHIKEGDYLKISPVDSTRFIMEKVDI